MGMVDRLRDRSGIEGALGIGARGHDLRCQYSEGAGHSRARLEKSLRRARGCAARSIPAPYVLALHGRSDVCLHGWRELAMPGTRRCMPEAHSRHDPFLSRQAICRGDSSGRHGTRHSIRDAPTTCLKSCGNSPSRTHGAFCRIFGTPSAPTSSLTSELKGSSEVVGTPMALLKRGQAPAYLDAWDAGDENCGVSSDDQNAMDVPHRDARSGAAEGQSHDSENLWLSTPRLPSIWPGYLPWIRVTFIPVHTIGKVGENVGAVE
jgi:hypothetical protein